MRFGWRTLAAPGALVVLGTVCAGQVYRHQARPRVCCTLPERDYVRANPPTTLGLAVSSTAVLLRKPDLTVSAPATPGERVALFQLSQSALAVDHCSLSRVALLLRDDGSWALSFRADQNPVVPVAPPLPARTVAGSTALALQTLHIRRNQFFVRVRGYGAFLVAPPGLDLAPGRPVLFEIAVDPFWVQRGVPEFLTFRGSDPSVAYDFALIDRVEVELRYR
jgi:hypothetical protein